MLSPNVLLRTVSLWTTLALSSSLAFGQSSSPSTASPSWVPGSASGYIGGSIGRTDYDFGGCSVIFGCDGKATGFKAYTGGRFSHHLGLELGYVNLGEASSFGSSIKAQGANLSMVGNIPVSDAFNLSGKVGGIYGWTKSSFTGNDDGLGLSYGVGMQYDLNKTVGIRLDWDRYRLKFFGRHSDADLLSTGLVFKF